MDNKNYRKVTEDYFTKTICFHDINYQLARNEDKEAIFQEFCNLHNYFDDSLNIQFTYMNVSDDADNYKKCIQRNTAFFVFTVIEVIKIT